jgi:hypothetical protein
LDVGNSTGVDCKTYKTYALDSARMLRAELPVHKKQDVVDSLLPERAARRTWTIY